MNSELLSDLLIAVEQQLVSPQTKYVAKAFDRLKALGIDEVEAKTQIAICLGEEMDQILRTKKPFDEKSYQTKLKELPMVDEPEGANEPTEDPA